MGVFRQEFGILIKSMYDVHRWQAWPQCVKQIKKHADKMGVQTPDWLTDSPPSKGWGNSKSEL